MYTYLIYKENYLMENKMHLFLTSNILLKII